MLMMSQWCEVSSDGVLSIQNRLRIACFCEKRKMRSNRQGQSNTKTKVSKDNILWCGQSQNHFLAILNRILRDVLIYKVDGCDWWRKIEKIT
jgi:hypothetical protein